MNEDKVKLQMTFDFNLTSSSIAADFIEHFVDNKFPSTSAVVISLQDMLDKRREEQQVTLYKQIASSIAHLR